MASVSLSNFGISGSRFGIPEASTRPGMGRGMPPGMGRGTARVETFMDKRVRSGLLGSEV